VLFEHANAYRDVYRAMLGQNAGAVVTNRMRAVLMDLVKDDLARVPTSKKVDAIPRTALVQYIVGALLSVLTWWVDEATSHSPDEVDAIFRRLTLPSILAI
jgi:hypothetical protein